MMAESGRYALDAQLDINPILLEAKHRWLRPAEICAILQNYKKCRITPEPPNRPPSGSLFLFDRKVLRHFRRDGHNWRKNKNGRTMKEAHERLKSGSVDVLHCYYSYGEDNEKFQRRSYWMLEEELSHIALVHYMEVKGNRTNFNQISDANGVPASRQNEEDISNTKVDSSAASRVQPCDYRSASPVTDKTSLNSTQASEREEAEPDINQILLEVQHRWLHPSEICEILQNYKKFGIAPEPPNRPQSGSLFLFDRKVLRYFRKDGHNWKKKKDGKKVNEAHERLKAESIDVLHCYYAHGEDNENFQRRSYWMLKEELSHIVLVHYLEVKGNRTNFNCITDADGIPASWKNEEDISNPKVDNSAASRFQPYDYQRASPVTDTTSLNSTQASEHEASDRESLHVSKWSIDQKSGGNLNLGQNPCNPSLGQPLSYDLTTKLNDVDQVEVSDSMGLHDTYLTDQSGQPLENDLQLQALNTVESSLNLEPDGNVNVGGAMQEGLKSPDSLDRWISEELGDVTESTMQPDFVAYWGAVGSEDDCAFLLLPQKTQNAGQHDEPRQAAAIRLQSKFRSWRGRKDFLLIRQSIIKIQAHVRGHQVRKNYRKIIWSVGILEKSILRWRRKGRGLSGLSADTSMVDAETKEDDYDFLKEMQDNETKMVGNSPCASCQLLRRRCAKDCIFAPYFPSDDPHKFAIVHKVFCASNVSKMLQEIPVHQRADAVSCLVYEANARVRDPVYGCVGAISYLQNQVSQLQMLLAETQAEILCNQMQQQDLLMAAT